MFIITIIMFKEINQMLKLEKMVRILQIRFQNFIFNHFEYDSDTLKQEYDRDVSEGTPINVPSNYYPDDDPSNPPQNRWRSHAHLLYGNWISEIYQTTPFDLSRIGHEITDLRA